VRRVLLLICAAWLAVQAGTAAAEDLRGRIAMTGRVGVINPANSERADRDGTLVVSTDAGIIGGGGFLVGVDENLAVDVEVTRSSYTTYGLGTAGVTDLGVGLQYRFPERRRFVPYGAAGLDVLINDLSDRFTDTVVGFHVAAGVDYMLLRDVALNAELKGVEAFSADVRGYNGVKVGEFDPTNVSLTFGARFFFN
jgi:outer membrane protein